MNLITKLGHRKAAFFFLERGQLALDGDRELSSLIARWLVRAPTDADLPEAVPIWHGSYLPSEDAIDRWTFGEVYVVLVGLSSAEKRRSLMSYVRNARPVGMFDDQAVADRLELPLVFKGFAFRGVLLRVNESYGYVDRETGVTNLGVSSELERTMIDACLATNDDGGYLERYLLKIVSRNVGRMLDHAGPSDGYQAMVDGAFELFRMGAIGAAGTTAGAAFEFLMRSSLPPNEMRWLREREKDKAVQLNDVLGKLIKAIEIDGRRLRGYQQLRNDLAHRLGESASGPIDSNLLTDAVAEFLNWLDQQEIDDRGRGHLTAVAPNPPIDFDRLFIQGRKAADHAAERIEVRKYTVGSDSFEPLGHAWLTVRGRVRGSAFERWLVENGHASPGQQGAVISAPDSSFSRNLAWVTELGRVLRQAGFSVRVDGRPN